MRHLKLAVLFYVYSKKNNKSINYLLILLLVIFKSTILYSQPDIESNLIGFWRFENNLNDETSNGNNAIFSGGVTYVNHFSNCGARALSLVDNSYITIPNHSSYNFGMGAFTVAMEIKYNTSQPDNNFASITDKLDGSCLTTSTGINIFIDFPPGGTVGLAQGRTQNSSNVNSLSNINLRDNNWHCLVFTREPDINGTTCTLKMYIDGNLNNTSSGVNLDNVSNLSNLIIGASSCDLADQNYIGLLDNYRLFNRALSVDDILYLCNCPPIIVIDNDPCIGDFALDVNYCSTSIISLATQDTTTGNTDLWELYEADNNCNIVSYLFDIGNSPTVTLDLNSPLLPTVQLGNCYLIKHTVHQGVTTVCDVSKCFCIGPPPSINVTAYPASCLTGTGGFDLVPVGGTPPYSITITGPSPSTGFSIYNGVSEFGIGVNNFPVGQYVITICDAHNCCSTVSSSIILNTDLVSFNVPVARCTQDPPITISGSPSGGTFSSNCNCISANGFFDPASSTIHGDITITYTLCGVSTSRIMKVVVCGPCGLCYTQREVTGTNILPCGDIEFHPPNDYFCGSSDLNYFEYGEWDKFNPAKRLFGGYYSIVNSSKQISTFRFNEVYDHTIGTIDGRFMLISGSRYNSKDIFTRFRFLPGTNTPTNNGIDIVKGKIYKVSFWIYPNISKLTTERPRLFVFLNGINEHIAYESDFADDQWNLVSFDWQAPYTGQTDFVIRQIQVGNGFVAYYGLDDIAITELCAPTLSIDLGPDKTFIEGNGTTLTASGVHFHNPVTYNWKPGTHPNSPTITVNPLVTTTYIVTAVDEWGCTDSDTIKVSPIYIRYVKNENLCFQPGRMRSGNGSIEITEVAGPAPYQYNWSNGATTALISNLSLGIYTVIVTDGNGTTYSEAITISQPDPISITAQLKKSCENDSTGSIKLKVSGGTSPYYFTWSNGSNNPFLNNLSVGNYSVSVMDTNGCTGTQSFSILQSNSCITQSCNTTSKLDELSTESFDAVNTISNDFIHNCTCNSGSYCIEGNATDKCSQFSSISSESGSGKFLIVEGSNSIVNNKVWSKTINVIGGKTYVINSSFYINLTPSYNSPSFCFAVNNSNINCVDSTDLIKNEWSSASASYTPSTSGTIEFSIVQSNTGGAYGIDNVSIFVCNEIPIPIVNSNTHFTVCPGSTTDSITVSVASGIPPYEIVFGDSLSTFTIRGLPAGEYPFTVYDSVGTFTNDTIVVINNIAPNIPSAINSSQCGYGIPTATVNGSGGSFRWYLFPTGGTPIAGETSNHLVTTPISVTTDFYVSEFDGTCESDRVQVSAFSTKPDSITASISSTCSNITLSVNQTGSNNSYTYVWTANPSSGSGISGSTTGSIVPISPTPAQNFVYTVIGTDDNVGCATISTVTLSSLTLRIDTIKNITCITNNGIIGFTGIGGSGGYNYDVEKTTPLNCCVTNDCGINPDFVCQNCLCKSSSVGPYYNLSAGVYHIIVTDSQGCTAEQSITLSDPGNCNIVLNLNILLQGYYSGNGMMDNFGLGGLLNVTGISGNPLDADSIFVSAMEPTPPYAEVDRQAGILNTNGSVSVTLGSGAIINNSYYIKLKHRNSVETWSAIPVLLTSTTSYSFTISPSQAFQSNEAITYDALFAAIYSGDINQDGSVDASDFLELDPGIQNGDGGYDVRDLNGDGSVDASDFLILDPNIQNGIGASTP